MTVLSARDVSVAPPGAPDPVVRGVSLEVRDGQWVALTGPNGGGKTSLLLALGGLWPAAAGEVQLDGRPVLPPPQVRGRLADSPTRASLAVVLQDPGVQMLQASVAEELAFAARNLGRPAPEVERAVVDWAARLGLEPLLGRDPRTLSAGQQQMVLVAASMVAGPRVLIADEPGAHLDAAGRARVLGAIREEVDRGLAVVWASQDAVELAAADRVTWLGRPIPARPCGNGTRATAPALLTLGIAPEPAVRPGGPRVPTDRALEIVVFERGVTALTGPNGCGKSVILAAASGWSPSPQIVTRWSRPPSPPPIIATQYPEHQLFEEVVAEELVWAAASRGLERARVLERAASYLAELGIEPGRFLERRLWSLSGGERRIAAVLGVLVAPASLRVLDEPTAGLDPGRRQALAALIARVAASDPVLLASQDAAWVDSLASSTVRLGAETPLAAPSPSKKTD